MSRIPASASIALAGLLPVYAAALGLGEVESKSYLNQPLAAEIPVFTDAPGELNGLNVALASADTFSQYGLQRPAFLSDIAFSVVPGPRGAVIRMTSSQPVEEPFVTVLLEVRWPQGRLLREYTVLLDPPTFAGGTSAPVAAPATRAPSVPAAAPSVPTQSAIPSTPAPEPAMQPAPEATPAAVADTSTLSSDGTHTVARNETLWGIADQYRPESSTNINQMMLAIYRANPEAFAGNINRLNAGAVLRIPDRAAVDGVDRGQAGAEVQRQTDEWRGDSAASTASAPRVVEEPARLELVPPAETVAAPRAPAVAPSSQVSQLASEVEESRRLVAVKDAELQALRNRVAQLEKQQAGDVALQPAPETEAPVAPLPAEEPVAAVPGEEPAVVAPPGEEAAPAPQPDRPKRVQAQGDQAQEQAREQGIVGTILGLLTSIWLWVAAAAVLIAALLLSRRRSAGDDEPAWRPMTRRGGSAADDEDDTGGRGEDMIVIEEPGRTGGFERRAAPRTDEETALERTISTDGPVNLDQSDPLAEADFHMAYGLYDQAADLLIAAQAREPARRDLQLKLLDVYFVWENRDGFLKEAKKLRERVGNDSDADWKRVGIMGKQLLPSEQLFAGAAAPEADEMDFAFDADEAAGNDGSDGSGLDFDLSGEEGDIDSDAATKVARPWSSAQTQEIPTLEIPAAETRFSTMETPTIENAALSSTLDQPLGERTLETPTVETWSPDVSSTAKLAGMSGDDRAEQTAEIDLEDLGLDLTGLDEAARDMTTGYQEALSDPAGGIDLDLSGESIVRHDVDESTTELENNPTLGNLAKAMGRETGSSLIDDTAEQLGIDAGATQSSRSLSATSDELESLNIDLDLGGRSDDSAASDLTATGLRAIGGRRPEDPTMTEVGTKLDLARAYVDMGDPDGARSILNEVLEEGDPAQQQEARQMLDGLNG